MIGCAAAGLSVPWRERISTRSCACWREGFTTRRGRRGALIHRDAVNGVLRGRRGARTTALTSGGTIPDTADYQVLLEPENQTIGTVNEDFAVESMAGDIFQLGNASYRIQRVERGTVRVEDAKGQPPNIPVLARRSAGPNGRAVDRRLASARRDRRRGSAPTRPERAPDAGSSSKSASPQLRPISSSTILPRALSALGAMPTQDTIVFERFFDEAGGMQLVIHAPFGSRLNRAWGLALRKRFCRTFNFELQAAATEDNIVLSLTTAHSFELGDVARYLHSNSVREVLIQAMLDSPMFTTRWRWVAGVSLALPRFRAGKKVPPQFLRMQAEDLVAAVFPDQIACAENLVGEREVPDHPLTNQAIHDCLHEAMDLEGLQRLLRRLEAGEIELVSCDLTEPSPLALEALSARPYAFLDDAPLEERRTQAVMARRWRDPQSASDLGRLDPRGDRQGSVRGLARSRQRRGASRRAALARLSDRNRGPRSARLERMARGAGARQARRAPEGARRDACGFRPSGSLNSAPFGQRRGSSRRSRRPPNRPRTTWSSEERAGRDPARQARGSRAGHADGACRAART